MDWETGADRDPDATEKLDADIWNDEPDCALEGTGELLACEAELCDSCDREMADTVADEVPTTELTDKLETLSELTAMLLLSTTDREDGTLLEDKTGLEVKEEVLLALIDTDALDDCDSFDDETALDVEVGVDDMEVLECTLELWDVEGTLELRDDEETLEEVELVITTDELDTGLELELDTDEDEQVELFKIYTGSYSLS